MTEYVYEYSKFNIDISDYAGLVDITEIYKIILSKCRMVETEVFAKDVDIKINTIVYELKCTCCLYSHIDLKDIRKEVIGNLFRSKGELISKFMADVIEYQFEVMNEDKLLDGVFILDGECAILHLMNSHVPQTSVSAIINMDDINSSIDSYIQGLIDGRHIRGDNNSHDIVDDNNSQNIVDDDEDEDSRDIVNDALLPIVAMLSVWIISYICITLQIVGVD